MDQPHDDASEAPFKLANPPIVEAVVDIDCDMPPTFELAALEGPARAAFAGHYPKYRAQFIEEHQFEQESDHQVKFTTRRAVQALQFLTQDEKQLVQVRAQGFSFNRLAPYGGLDDYLPEIERAWGQFVGVAAPVQIRAVRLRYINRILLPLTPEGLELEHYFKVSPRLPEEEGLTFIGFLNQHTVLELSTGHQANIVLSTQPTQDGQLPIIFDIGVIGMAATEPEDWLAVLNIIKSLRSLKNRIFRNTLTDKCLELFQK